MSPDVHTPDRLSLAAPGARPRSGEGTRIPTCAEGAARRRAEPYTDGQYHDSGGGVPGYVEFSKIGKVVTRHPLRRAYVPADAGLYSHCSALASRRNRRERRNVPPGEHASGSPAAVS